MNTIMPSVTQYASLARYAAPAPGSGSPSGPTDSFVCRYADNVKQNCEKDGVGWTLLASGAYDFVGGLLGGLGGSLVGSVLPAPVGLFVANACEIAGGFGGFLFRLGRKPH